MSILSLLKRPKGIAVEKRRIAADGRKVPVLILRPRDPAGEEGPGVLWLHGGGYFTGMKELVFLSRAVDLVTRFGAVVVSPGYRLALFHPYPAALDDSYAALLFLREHCGELGVRSDQIMVGGESAGGGLAAAVCMRARDEKTVRVACQMPLYPMLSNADTDTSRDNHGRVWNTRRNHFGWRLYLRGDAKKPVSPYASPARQTDYTDLPPCYTFVGDGEPFYAETLQYVEDLRAAGVEARVDVYPTDIHAFDMLFPKRAVSRQAAEAFNAFFAYAREHCFARQI